MIQYTHVRPGMKQPVAQHNRGILFLVAFIAFAGALYTARMNGAISWPGSKEVQKAPGMPPAVSSGAATSFRTDSVGTVVAKALYFKSLLTTQAQLSSLEQTYTTALARKWSNLPCGSGCRNGIQLGSLTATQLSAALDVIRAASGTAANEGYDEFNQVRLADKYLGLNGGGNGYDSTIYFLSFLNTPTATGAWMLQFGGHHYAANIAFNGGKVVGTTPHFMGVEPLSFTLNNVTYAPLKQERDSFSVMLGSLTTAQLASAKITSTYSDVTLSPGETNGGSGTFPATKVGLKAVNLTTAQKNRIIAAIKNYTSDVDDSSGAVLQALYASEIDSTYIAWTGSGTTGDTSTFLNANTNYIRIDGPSVWIEFICQTGVVFRSQVHYHTVYRDHYRDYGLNLTRTSLPLHLLSFDAAIQNKGRLLSWTTADEKAVSYFEVQRSVNATTDFSVIGKVGTKDNSRGTYTYVDEEGLNEDVIYYRLRIVDLDGYSRYGNVAAVKYNSMGKGISIYPNPASNLLTISQAEDVQNATIRIVSSAGKTVVNSTGRTGRKLNVDISHLAPGSYYVQLLNNGSVSTLKFVKQK